MHITEGPVGTSALGLGGRQLQVLCLLNTGSTRKQQWPVFFSCHCLVAKWSFEKEQKDHFLAYCPWNDDGKRGERKYPVIFTALHTAL